MRKSSNKDLSASKVIEALTPKEGDTPDQQDASGVIPPVKSDIDEVDLTAEEVIGNDSVDPRELALGMLPEDKGVKFTIDPFEVQNNRDAQDTFRDFFEKFKAKKHTSPDVLYINKDSLERLGWRDVASELGLTIQETTTYKTTEMVLGLK